MADSTARETISREGRSVWMLSKIEGNWKITSAIAGVSTDEKVRKWGTQ